MSSIEHPATVASVYIQLKTRSLAKPFDYRVPAGYDGSLDIGSVVLVPFGRQKVLGIVGALSSSSQLPSSRLVDIEDVIEYPAVPEPLIRLALWIADYYYCSPAVALGLVLPPGGLPTLTRTVSKGKAGYTLSPPAVKPRMASFVRIARGGGRGNKFRRTGARLRVLDCLTGNGEEPLAELCRRANVGRATVKAMAELGVVEIFQRSVRRDALRYYSVSGAEPEAGSLSLNRAQEQALAAIVKRMDQKAASDRSRPLLLQGIPGSGKTEVYIRAIEAAVGRGGSAIVLIPEISLTHQAVRRFRRRFGERVGIIHSALTPGERYDEYMRVRSGEVSVVVGPRSALFAPLPNLRLIVVDEENDSSFKQESDPRYDARRVALERARIEGAVLVFGSATPSLESYLRVTDRFTLPERATGAPLAAVEIVDMREESDPVFSGRLLDGLERTLAAGEKSILLLNRRGYARFLQCGHCGHVWECENCDVSLTVHSRIRRLLCHHCGYGEDMPGICPECNHSGPARWGVGTERLEKEMRARFPEAKVFRLDADTAGGYGEGPRILDEFSGSGGAILLGTQMVAKGHHFPDVTLAAVINADLALQFPEFRAEEQTFALLLQLAGRSGRAHRPGKVLIQTWNAGIECIKMAADQAVEEFYEAELERRRRLEYPPFVSLINIVCLSRQGGKSGQAAGFIKQKLEPVLADERVLGPADLFRLQGWSRSHILIKTGDVRRTLDAFRPVLERYREPFSARGVRMVVDVDPQWLS